MTKRKAKPRPGRPAASPPSSQSLREATAIAGELLATEATLVTRALVHKAIAGNMHALRLCIERLVPLVRERALPIKIPAAHDALQITIALQAVFDGLGAGHLTAGEAQKLAALLENQRKAIETGDLEARLEALEAGPQADTQADDPYQDLPREIKSHEPDE